ncbi:MAG: bifunctional UDP-N-acetylglucosamine pyrophosphorylase / Glucosamine-1-phosphate N-acetyltransferase [Parcubacteria group bacterium Gr01-1014_48]|nr:MAG: bifunctional UDP-N-acetylglucosamine pyrophosphorylase / Glucosamine-1-phosphate N-acetyltransferase [Parcubacteria group bacterium Greene0416_14]TSC72525.1 MAG: bifunctional UDP-N-acetylglucosamine pyrophosphorylase / Glucosamine-1-phosphate N-acetyltransferase [Parcubacteria group bacterium Gr01-1014_48]TSD00872.1 MAG: bifunctional UDP-N-acetylglucosamine pyrophosphorylase / Glucosamine-1-phosphate N-acetyltransferase [Parcubacteria group bacterium Greene1014_15]TSD07954.1 MAG: bifunct
MSSKPFAVVILAAGKGKRMGIKEQKACIPVGGKPMIVHVLSAAFALRPATTIVVVGHDADTLRDAVRSHIKDTLQFVHQKEQLGTGHALLTAHPLLSKFYGDILVLYADIPLIGTNTLKNLLSTHQRKNAIVTILTAHLHDPHGYGRIKRDAQGYVSSIVEEKDATEAEKKIREINSGIYCFRANKLWEALPLITNNNAQREYYLTDVIPLLAENGEKIHSVASRNSRELLGINTNEQLEEARKILSDKYRMSPFDESSKYDIVRV